MASEILNQSVGNYQMLIDKLDKLIAPENYLTVRDQVIVSKEAILSTHMLQVRQMIPFEVCGFMIRNEDEIDFSLIYWWPDQSGKETLEKVIDTHIDGGTYSLALQQNRPIVTYPDDLNRRSQVLHVLTTRNKIIGMFIGVISGANAVIDEISLKLLSIVLADCAYVLESNELSKKINDHNNDLAHLIDKRTEQLLKEKEKAEAASKSKSQFLSTMSHELRTPLTAVIGFAQTIKGSLQQSENDLVDIRQVSEQADIIEKSAKHLLLIISDILDLSKIESGNMDIEKIDFCPATAIEEIKNIIDLLAKEKGLGFEICYHFPFPKEISSDPIRLKQILLNLCSNAIKFSDTGTIKVDALYKQENSLLEISVKDEGIGIPVEQHKNILEPFRQADNSTTRQHGGTGLGLSICNQLTKLLGGDFSFVSEPGQGSQFSFSIDSGVIATDCLARNSEELLLTKTDTNTNSNTNTKTNTNMDIKTDIKIKPKTATAIATIPELVGNIVVAEDSAINQQLIGLLLDKTGVTYNFVDNGEAALEMVLEQDTDLLLMDIHMPIMDGEEAASLLRSSGYSGPIIAWTANVIKEDIERYRISGFTAVLSKPINRQELYDLLTLYLQAACSKDRSGENQDSSFTSKYQSLVKRFVEGLQQQMCELKQAYEENALVEVANVAHILKGSGTSFGFPEITEVSKRIEASAKAKDISALDEPILQLQKLINTIVCN